MAVKEADLTGIDNVNEYYTNHYLHTMFANSIQTDITAWKNAVKENADTQAPWSRLQACARSYYAAHAQFQKQVVNARRHCRYGSEISGCSRLSGDETSAHHA